MAAFKVEGMTCGGCAAAVKKAVASVAPGAAVQVDLASKLVRVEGPADEVAVKAAIRTAGFEVAP